MRGFRGCGGCKLIADTFNVQDGCVLQAELGLGPLKIAALEIATLEIETLYFARSNTSADKFLNL